MPKYGASAKKEVKKAVHKTKEGTQKSGKGGKAKSRKQAIAIGLSKARKKAQRFRRKRRVEEDQRTPDQIVGRRNLIRSFCLAAFVLRNSQGMVSLHPDR